MRDLSTLAKLLAEEDINVVHRNQSTAMFDVLNRELSLPIWKEMSKNVQDLMTVHEVGHALWTPLKQLERAKQEKVEFSFVNVLEDVRIEKLAQKKYAGTVRVFKKGYKELKEMNFFETADMDINKLSLIDRINLFYKHHADVQFAEEEKVWVQKANQTVTPDDVIDLAKELFAFMQENPETQDKTGNGDDSEGADGQMMETPTSGGQEKSDGTDGQPTPSTGQETGDDKTDTTSGGQEKSDETGDDKSTETTTQNQAEGGEGSGNITATTDTAAKRSTEKMLSEDKTEYTYSSVPKIDMKNAVVNYKTVLETFFDSYSYQAKQDNHLYWNETLTEFETTKKDSKKTVAYMVKEFEMKKAADLYARASSSKTGNLDMSKLHTYKYNDDLFAKVTTLPGATNHGLVIFLDWSGSMAHNLTGTLNQLYNLIWFCNSTKIPFEVFAFSDCWDRNGYDVPPVNAFKSGDMVLKGHLLQFFSSKMTTNDQNAMMHYLYMVGQRWCGYRDWRTVGYPYTPTGKMNLGSTPLNDAIVMAMDVIPAFQSATGVQKIHTVFLTDGASNTMHDQYHTYKDDNGEIRNGTKGMWTSWSQGAAVFTDPKTGAKVVSSDFREGRGQTQTKMLLALLKKRVPDMSVVNFFIAGAGRSGKVHKNLFYDFSLDYKDIDKMVTEMKKNNCVIIPEGQGFDNLYILPGLSNLDMDSELDVEVGAGKGALKRAFGKMSKGKMTNRPVLNNFIKMVA